MRNTHTLKVGFTGSNGNRLDGRLELPEGAPRAFIVFNHCFTCTKDILTAYRSSRVLAQNGYAVLRYDFAGLGDSEGDFARCNFTTNVEDTHAAIDFLGREYTAPRILIGHSLGGTAALAAAVEANSIEKVVTLASPAQPAHVLHHFDHAVTLLEQGIPASFEVGGRFYDIEPQFIADVRRWDMQKVLPRLHKPVLIVEVENDALVEADNAEKLSAWLPQPPTRLRLQNTDHLLSDKQAHLHALERIVQWLRGKV